MTKHIYLVYSADEDGRQYGSPIKVIVSPHSLSEVRLKYRKEVGHSFNYMHELTLNEMKREYLKRHKAAREYGLLLKEALRQGAK